MQEVKYIDRKSGDSVTEKVPIGGMMKFLYSQNFVGRFLLWGIVKRRIFSIMAAWYMSNSISSRSIHKFVKKHRIYLSDYKIPEGGFKHFNRFFYRKLKPNMRPIGEGIISPADGKILVFPTIESSQAFYIKGEKFDLITFLNNEELAGMYSEGSMAIIRLAPTDYHRFHFPVAGYVKCNHKINGYYYSVSPLALKQNVKIFWQNKREYVTLDSNDFGPVIISEVGATLTGGIIQSHWPEIDVYKGEEKGYFAFGGSTVIVLFQKEKMSFSDDLIRNTAQGLETSVKMGETIGMSPPLNR